MFAAGDVFSQRTAQADRNHYASWSRNYFMKAHTPVSSGDVMFKPQSAMNILPGANRVLRQIFNAFIPLGALKLPFKGIMR